MSSADKDPPDAVLNFENLRIAERFAVFHRVAVDYKLMFFKRNAAVETISHPLILIRSAVHGIVDKDIF